MEECSWGHSVWESEGMRIGMDELNWEAVTTKASASPYRDVQSSNVPPGLSRTGI